MNYSLVLDMIESLKARNGDMITLGSHIDTGTSLGIVIGFMLYRMTGQWRVLIGDVKEACGHYNIHPNNILRVIEHIDPKLYSAFLKSI